MKISMFMFCIGLNAITASMAFAADPIQGAFESLESASMLRPQFIVNQDVTFQDSGVVQFQDGKVITAFNVQNTGKLLCDIVNTKSSDNNKTITSGTLVDAEFGTNFRKQYGNYYILFLASKQGALPISHVECYSPNIGDMNISAIQGAFGSLISIKSQP